MKILKVGKKEQIKNRLSLWKKVCEVFDFQWLIHMHHETLMFLLHFMTVWKAHWPPATLFIFADLNFTN